jgi:RNA polymerase sigma factor (sigma-70 family)
MRPVDKGSALEIFLSHRTSLVRYVTPIVGCASVAEDVVQEAYIRYVPVESGVGIRFRVGYLYRTVRNIALDLVRAQTSAERHAVETLNLQPAQAVAGPDEVAAARDELRRVASAMEALPPRTRQIFELHRLEGRTLQEIAEMMDISVTRVHQVFRQAMTQIADAIDPWDDLES